jgi:hypothetical protein
VSQVGTDTGLRDLLIQVGLLSTAHLDNFPPGDIVEPVTEKSGVPPDIPLEILGVLPEGFRRLASKGALSKGTINVIAGMAAIPSHQDSNLRQRAVSPVKPGASRPLFFSNDIGLLEKLLCLALLRHNVNGVTKIRHAVCPYEDVALTLTRKLPEVLPPQSRAEREALMWIWMVAIDAWSFGTKLGHLAPCGMELLTQFVRTFPETRAWDLHGFEKLGTSFFWRVGIVRWLRPAWEFVRNQIRLESGFESLSSSEGSAWSHATEEMVADSSACLRWVGAAGKDEFGAPDYVMALNQAPLDFSTAESSFYETMEIVQSEKKPSSVLWGWKGPFAY